MINIDPLSLADTRFALPLHALIFLWSASFRPFGASVVVAMILLYHATAKAVMLGPPGKALQETTIPQVPRPFNEWERVGFDKTCRQIFFFKGKPFF